MVLSKNARRALNRRQFQVQQGNRRRGGLSDWITSVIGLDSAGAETTTNVGSWDATMIVASASAFTVLATIVRAAPASSTPLVGRLRVEEIRGSIFVRSDNLAGQFRCAVGIYVSDFRDTTNWAVRNPMTDPNRDDYLFLEGVAFKDSATATQTSDLREVEVQLRISQPIVIGSGQALAVTIANSSGSTGSIASIAFFRTRIGAVA